MDSLTKIIKETEALDINIEPFTADFPSTIRDSVLQTNFYWGLAAYISLFKVKKVLELGTCTGASAAIMARAGAEVDTYDLLDKWELPKIDNLYRHIVPQDYLEFLKFEGYDMIFVDVGHDGKAEQEIHEKLTKEYKGIVFYDDIIINQDMIYFWNGIKQDKLPLFWHVAKYPSANPGGGLITKNVGFGIVRY
jgi:predicted O-methyltransferase YrrM